jgi:RimJ/RimL family protein N-acetyltransferase
MFARTERLLLRPGWIEDAPALFKAISEEAIVRNLASAPWPYRLADAEAFLSTDRSPGEPSMLIFRRTQGAPQLIGTVGFGRRPDAEPEFGYWIARPYWGLGYATEAGCAAIAMARESLRLKRLHAGHFLDNPASGRVLTKLGFRPSGVIAPRYSAGRRETAPCRLFDLELDTEGEAARERFVPACQSAGRMAA